MKRGIIVLLLVTIMLIPAVSATISITGPSHLQYNIGHEIDLTGYIQETEDFSGELQFSLVCGSKTYKLQPLEIDVSANEQVSFSQFSLPSLTASSSMLGLCKIKADILVNGLITETASSSSFEITNDLDASFSVDKNQIQLGDTITVTGSASDLHGNLLDGAAEIYFESQEEEYLMDFVPVENGVFSYAYSFLSGNTGSYEVNIIIRDSYGNEDSFAGIDSFTVLDDLQVTVNTNAQSFSPGDVVNVYGDVKTVLQDYVLTATVEISLDEDTQSAALADSKFTHDISIPTAIPSGQHIITVEAEDIYGNAGSASLTIEVNPKATAIENRISNGTLSPEQQLSIGVTLYDQAGDVMTDIVHLDVSDSSKRIVSQAELASEEDITYLIPKFAPPGEWTVKSYYTDEETQEEIVSTVDTITINEVQALDYEFVGDILYITNVGNVRYTDDVNIVISGVDQEYLITKTRNLGVNETIAVDLAAELPSGTYSISVPTGFNTAEESEVSIDNGKIQTALTWPYTILAVIFILALGYLVYARLLSKKEEKKEQVQQPSDKIKKKIRLYDPKREAEKGKKINLTFEDKEHSLQDFKQRTLEEIKRTEEKIQKDSRRSSSLSEGKLGYVTGRNDPVGKPKPVQEKPSVFNLFDE